MGNSSIFSLDQVYKRQTTNKWVNIYDPFIYVASLNPQTAASSAHGYSGGGGAGTFGTRETGGTLVQRINFNNDTATTNRRGELARDHMHGAAFGNTTHGYVMGDLFTTTPRSWVSRITYSNDGATGLTRGNMTVARGGGSATGNASYAWVSGAWDWIYHNAGPNASVVNRIDFSNDSSTMSARGNLDRAVGKVSASGNANYGWWYGGLGQSSVSRVDYGNDTATASPKGTMSTGVNENTAVGNVNYGYTTRGSSYHTDFLRYDYASDTGASTPKGSLSFSRNDFAGATGSQSYGYFMGGTTYPTYYTSIDRIDYSNDTATASPKGNLQINVTSSNGQRRAGGFSGQSNAFGSISIVPATQTENGKLTDKGSDGYMTTISPGPAYGYFAGSYYPYRSDIDRIDYSNDTATASVRGRLPVEASYGGGTGNDSYGYSLGGWKQPGAGSYVFRQDYASDTTTSSTRGPLSVRGYHLRAIGNNDYGYCGGRSDNQNQTNNYSIIDRIDYSNDTATATVTAPAGMVPSAQSYITAGNQSYGYFVGGYSPAIYDSVSSVRRLDYASDTGTSLKAPLTFKTQRGGGASNQNYGYITSGQSGYHTVVHRIDFANDSATPTPKGPLSYSQDYRSGTGSADYGYISGGDPAESRVDRIDYANDTTTASPKGPLSSPRKVPYPYSAQENGLTSIGYIPRIRWVDNAVEGTVGPPVTSITFGPAFGYFAGSYNNKSSVDRVDYNNDTATASPKGNLLTEASQGGGAGNLTHGYCIGGHMNYNIRSYVYRVDYANDTATSSPRGNTALAGNYVDSVGNSDFAFSGGRGGGGIGPTNLTMLDRIYYANDTSTATSLGNNFNPRGTAYGTCGNQNYGCFCGGMPGTSHVRRLTYSNHTAGTSPKGALSANSNYCAGTSNANYGYITGNEANVAGSYGTKVDRIDFANDTAIASPKGPLTTAGTLSAGTGSPNYGYFAGRDPGSTRVDRIDYSNDTAAAASKGPLSTTRRSSYSFSGQENGLQTSTTSPGSPILAPTQPPFLFPVQLDPPPPPVGYFAGGYNYNPSSSQNDVTKVERINFANDTATALIRGDLSNNPGSMLSVTSSLNYGYVAGGHVVPVKSTISRIDYSNDTAQSATKGPLSLARGQASGFGNKNYGYHAGGMNFIGSPSFTQIAYSTVDRIDYANDSSTASPKGPLSAATAYQTGGGNLSYGYYVGRSPSTGAWGPSNTRVDRVDYANDSSTASPRGNMNNTKATRAAAGNNNYGYFTQGYPAATLTSRIDYANDNVTASPKGNFWIAAYKSAGTGTSDYGYVANGVTPSNSINGNTTVGRIDYSNDTVTAIQRGTMAIPKAMRPQGVSSQANGLPS